MFPNAKATTPVELRCPKAVLEAIPHTVVISTQLSTCPSGRSQYPDHETSPPDSRLPTAKRSPQFASAGRLRPGSKWALRRELNLRKKTASGLPWELGSDLTACQLVDIEGSCQHKHHPYRNVKSWPRNPVCTLRQ